MAARDPAFAAGAFGAARFPAGARALPERVLEGVLFVTILISSIVFIEPSPHDAMMFVLFMACVAARVPFDRKFVPLVVLIVLWLVGGGLSLIQLGDDKRSIQYFATSIYLGLAAVLFACLFGEGVMRRLFIMRRAYILAALIATVAGYAGFFHLVPGAAIFLDNERVSATFKDPNVYGPFLIYPLLLLIIGMLTQRLTLSSVATVTFLLGGLLLSFSRGAWFHFIVSALVAVVLTYAATPDPRRRARIVALVAFTAIGAALLLVALSSIDSVRDMLLTRARAIQPYDIGPGGRFSLQELALSAILDHPNGMGPIGFGLAYGGQQHNVYMQCFLVYGWLGGTMYLTLVLLTLALGLRNVLVPAPWQGFLIAAFAAYIGEILEGMIVDTDHWRHFFLIVGLIWGLSAANINWLRRHIAAGAPA